jgi:hypothetical protein
MAAFAVSTREGWTASRLCRASSPMEVEMAQNILSRALNGPSPEQALRAFLSQASLGEIEQTEKALLEQRAAIEGSTSHQDRAMVRVCDRWLEAVQEHKLAAQ